MTTETATGGLVRMDEHLSQRMQSCDGLDKAAEDNFICGVEGGLTAVVGLAAVGGACLVGTTTAGMAVTMLSALPFEVTSMDG